MSAHATPTLKPTSRAVHAPSNTLAGVLVGRPDLSEADVLEAIAERLLADGRTGPEPAVVLEAARLGKRKAITFLQKLVLPPPRSPLSMPIQPILRSHFDAQVRAGETDGAG